MLECWNRWKESERTQGYGTETIEIRRTTKDRGLNESNKRECLEIS